MLYLCLKAFKTIAVDRHTVRWPKYQYLFLPLNVHRFYFEVPVKEWIQHSQYRPIEKYLPQDIH